MSAATRAASTSVVAAPKAMAAVVKPPWDRVKVPPVGTAAPVARLTDCLASAPTFVPWVRPVTTWTVGPIDPTTSEASVKRAPTGIFVGAAARGMFTLSTVSVDAP